MKSKIYFSGLLLIGTLLGCIQHDKSPGNTGTSNLQLSAIEIKYAKGFEINYHVSYIQIISKSFGENQHFKDSIYLVTDADYQLGTALKHVDYNKIRLACQSTTHLSFIQQLNSLNSVCAVCGLNYVMNPNIIKILQEEEAIELCQSENVEMEALYAANPSLFLMYPFGIEENKITDEKGIQTFLIAEYLEESILGRLEWIKLFGLLLNKVDEANAYFESAEMMYNSSKVQSSPTNHLFILNLPYNDSWHMPASNSLIVQLIQDAGLTYFYSSEKGTENQLHSNEEVWNDGVLADYWIIMASRPKDFDLEDLIKEQTVYATFKSVKEKKVIFCNTAEVDYFCQGVLEPHVMLKDLLFATGQINQHQPKYFFRLE
jgi:iron complex transport system substrate-binding protein